MYHIPPRAVQIEFGGEKSHSDKRRGPSPSSLPSLVRSSSASHDREKRDDGIPAVVDVEIEAHTRAGGVPVEGGGGAGDVVEE